MKDEVRKYLKKIGRSGGASGRGNRKARSPEHYAKMVAIRERNRIKRRAAEIAVITVISGATWFTS